MRTSPARPVTTIQRHTPARRAIAVLIGAVAGAAAFCGVQVVAGCAAISPAERPAAARTALVERASCRPDGNDDSTSHEPTAPADEGAAPMMVVGVRPTAMLRLDGRGRVVAAWTNTGCAPRPTDDTYVAHPSGSIVQTSGSTGDVRWTGDFTESGVFVAQR